MASNMGPKPGSRYFPLDRILAEIRFIRREGLGAYDVFTLQVQPGTETRRQAGEHGLVYQDRPPYYVLATDRLSYAALRRLRRSLKRGAGLDPDEVEGCPQPRLDALAGLQIADCRLQIAPTHLVTLSPCRPGGPLERLWLLDGNESTWAAAGASIARLARHVDVVARWEDGAALAALLSEAIAANPATLFDCYLLAETAPRPEDLLAWRTALPYQPG